MGVFDGNVVIVTGGARGIGRAYCHGLAEEGASLVIADLNGADDVVAEVADLGAEAISVITDVSSPESTEAMAAAAVERFDRIDSLVNNAAFYTTATHAPMDELTPEEWDLCYAVNVKGSWLCARAVIPTMKRQQSGSIVNVASMTVNDGTPGFLHYVSSKSAIWGLTRAMSRELGPHGIRVDGKLAPYARHDQEYAAKQSHVDDIIKSRRALQRTQVPDDMVGTLLYLLSPWSDFVTGQNIWVNGGSAFH